MPKAWMTKQRPNKTLNSDAQLGRAQTTRAPVSFALGDKRAMKIIFSVATPDDFDPTAGKPRTFLEKPADISALEAS